MDQLRLGCWPRRNACSPCTSCGAGRGEPCRPYDPAEDPGPFFATVEDACAIPLFDFPTTMRGQTALNTDA